MLLNMSILIRRSSMIFAKQVPRNIPFLDLQFNNKKRDYSVVVVVAGYTTGGIYGFKVLKDIHESLWEDYGPSSFVPLTINFMFTPVICGYIGGIAGVTYPVTIPLYLSYRKDQKIKE